MLMTSNVFLKCQLIALSFKLCQLVRNVRYLAYRLNPPTLFHGWRVSYTSSQIEQI